MDGPRSAHSWGRAMGRTNGNDTWGEGNGGTNGNDT